MNENIDLTKILKDCPKGKKLYSPLYGEVSFKEIHSDYEYPIVLTRDIDSVTFTKEGFYRVGTDGECLLFPSREQRDWSKFTAPWYKKDKFDPKTLKPFDRVLTRHSEDERWDINFYSYKKLNWKYTYICIDGAYKRCIPYNDDTKYLIGTTEEAPEYYRYWED